MGWRSLAAEFESNGLALLVVGQVRMSVSLVVRKGISQGIADTADVVVLVRVIVVHVHVLALALAHVHVPEIVLRIVRDDQDAPDPGTGHRAIVRVLETGLHVNRLVIVPSHLMTSRRAKRPETVQNRHKRNRLEKSHRVVVPNRPERNRHKRNRLEKSHRVVVPNLPEKNLHKRNRLETSHRVVVPNRPETSHLNKIVPNRPEKNLHKRNRLETSHRVVVPNRPETSHLNEIVPSLQINALVRVPLRQVLTQSVEK
jgi:hypothetical protein